MSYVYRPIISLIFFLALHSTEHLLWFHRTTTKITTTATRIHSNQCCQRSSKSATVVHPRKTSSSPWHVSRENRIVRSQHYALSVATRHLRAGQISSSYESSSHSSFVGSPSVDDFGEATDRNGDFQHSESVEERIAAWRSFQQHRYENLSPVDAANPRDEEGRMKLLASVSRGSIALFFFILMWRSVHHYELADQSFRGSLRLVFVLPPIVLFLGNMAGCVAAITSPTNSAKKRMKAILNLNKIIELMILIYNIFRLTVFPNKYVMREIYVGRTLTNFLFLVQCQLFTKVAWGATQAKNDPSWEMQNRDANSGGYRDQNDWSSGPVEPSYNDDTYERPYETYARGRSPHPYDRR